tara:strand:+ start:47 stop:232 length:186 start_codon:yes stop_codon:yes gene_type:complete
MGDTMKDEQISLNEYIEPFQKNGFTFVDSITNDVYEFFLINFDRRPAIHNIRIIKGGVDYE